MAQFIDFGPRLSSSPPIACDKSVLYALQVAADPLKLRATCARVFNTSSNSINCLPVGDHVEVVFGTIDWVGTDKAKTGVSAGVTELQILFRIPVEVVGGGAGIPQLAYFSPFIWVNNPLSMVVGREVFGYPKSFAKITIAGPSNAPSVSVSTWCGDLKDRYWKEQELTKISLHKGSATRKAVTHTQKSQQLLNDWLSGIATEIFLKQFLAIDSTFQYKHACFQQIATAEYRVTSSPKQTVLPGLFDLTVMKVESAPLFDDLGVQNATGLEVTRLEIDSFTIGSPRVLWQAP